MVEKSNNIEKTVALFIGLILGVILFFTFLSCNPPQEQKPIDWRKHNDSIIKALNDSLDSTLLPANNIATEMKIRAKFKELENE